MRPRVLCDLMRYEQNANRKNRHTQNTHNGYEWAGGGSGTSSSQYSLYLPHSTPSISCSVYTKNHWVLCYITTTPHPSGLFNKDLTTAHRIENKSLITTGLYSAGFDVSQRHGALWVGWRWKIFMVEYFRFVFFFFDYLCVIQELTVTGNRYTVNKRVDTIGTIYLYITYGARFAAVYENILWSFFCFVCEVFGRNSIFKCSLFTKTTVAIGFRSARRNCFTTFSYTVFQKYRRFDSKKCSLQLLAASNSTGLFLTCICTILSLSLTEPFGKLEREK